MADPFDPDSQSPFVWPDCERVAFGPGPNRNLDARVDWIHSLYSGGVHFYMNGYEAAIEAVYEHAIKRKMPPEYALLPLAFLWRHLTEINLKSLLSLKSQLYLDEAAPSTGHDLAKLWSKLRPALERVGPTGAPEIENCEATILEFQKIDPRGDGFRYSEHVNRKNQRTKAQPKTLSKSPKSINIVGFNTAMKAVNNFLSSVSGEFSRRIDYFEDLERAMDGTAAIEVRRNMRLSYIEEHDDE